MSKSAYVHKWRATRDRSVGGLTGLTAGSTAQCCCKRFFANDLGKSEIGKLYRKILVGQEDVLWFDVSVDNVALVQVFDALKQLNKYFSCLGFT